MQRPWGRTCLGCWKESQQASDGGPVRKSTSGEDLEGWVPDDAAPCQWAQRMSGLPGTPEHPAGPGTLLLNETRAVPLRPAPDLPPSAGLYFWDAQGADPGEGAVGELRGSHGGDRGWGESCALPFSSYLHVFLPGVPASRHRSSHWRNEGERDRVRTLSRAQTRDSHAPDPQGSKSPGPESPQILSPAPSCLRPRNFSSSSCLALLTCTISPSSFSWLLLFPGPSGVALASAGFPWN